MARKKIEEQTIIEKIYDYTLEDIMGDRFGRYAKSIIQDRALPDVRDGLKPVQRRILYTMWEDRNTADKPYRKCAKAVGDVMGKYHPHGDSSIYGAMVYLSQDWKMRDPLVDIHGNNGSIDGYGPAAARYTECRLTKLAEVMLKDINKNTVEMALNYADEDYEPTVLPANFPNILVNGSTGISAGYATNIPPHNLGEVIDATIKRIESPNCRLDTILDIIKGPDFPTGGVIEGKQGLIQAYETGRGKVIVKAKTEIVEEKGKKQIIVHEIPYDVLKEQLRKKIEDIKIDKKVEGIVDVFDVSDEEHMAKLVIELKKDANAELILNYLLKNTDLQVNYNFNVVAIVNRRPKQLGILEILDAFIAHQKEVVTRRTEFDLKFAKDRMHIVEGLIKAISILDEVIATIRKSKNKADAIVNLQEKYDFTERQAEYIVNLQLYRLTNSDIEDFRNEYENLKKVIQGLQEILDDPEKLKSVMKAELRKVKMEYATERKTIIKDEITDISINEEEMIPKEDVIVLVTHDGYVKRTSKRSFNENEKPTLKEGDYCIGFYELNTMDTLLLFTNKGNFIYAPVYSIPDIKWKDLGKHISNIIKIDTDEAIVSCIKVEDFEKDADITLATKLGMIKRTKLSEFKVSRYTKPVNCMNLKGDDELIVAFMSLYNNVFVATKHGFGLWFDISDIPIVGLKTSGVKSINLKDDSVVSVNNFNDLDYISIVMNKGCGKRVKLSEFEKSTRARRGLMIVREVKTSPYKIVKTFAVDSKNYLGIKTDEINEIKLTELSIMDRYSTGNNITKKKIVDAFIVCNLVKKGESNDAEIKDIPKPRVSLKEIDERLLTIDDYI